MTNPDAVSPLARCSSGLDCRLPDAGRELDEELEPRKGRDVPESKPHESAQLEGVEEDREGDAEVRKQLGVA